MHMFLPALARRGLRGHLHHRRRVLLTRPPSNKQPWTIWRASTSSIPTHRTQCPSGPRQAGILAKSVKPAYEPQSTMTFAVDDACGVVEQSRHSATPVQKVEVLDVMDQTAVAKVTASWGIDHMHLEIRRPLENHQHRLAGASEVAGADARHPTHRCVDD